MNTRWAIRRDFQTIVQINNQTLPDITEDYLIKLHKNPQKPVSLVAEIKEIVVGFITYFIRSNRYEIVHIATDETYLRMGIATVLINNLKMKLVPSQEVGPQKDVYNYFMQSTSRSKISITIPDNLLPAHLFFKSCGFIGYMADEAYRFEYKI